MKLFSIEESTPLSGGYRDTTYRFRSLINNCVGGWCSYEKLAIKAGKQHQHIMETIYPALKSLEIYE